MADLVTFGETMLRLSPPEGERLETTETLDVRVGGTESNVAVAADRLGLDAVWLSKLPATPLGRRVTTALHARGLETDIVWTDENRQGTYFIEPGGRPRGTDVIYDRAGSAVTTATPAELPLDRLAAAELFFTTGITPALSPTLQTTTAEVLTHAAEAGTRTVFDLNYRSKLWEPDEAKSTLQRLFPAIDVLFIAERDAHTVLDRTGDPATIADGLRTDWGFETVVVTRGDAGALAWHDGEITRQATFSAETIDPIGTGDAFVGGFLAARQDDATIADALEYGAATAALKRTIRGDLATITPAEVERVRTEDTDEIER
ncbi:MAG: bifunctional 2-dehydro-3-deoxygluconokinase/2-dehydro-3-deoxygalactonokinase [Halobacteriales archaeon]|nr:bifunctional 2-dehydro-3-deoxygluconokinase/2-dehydro-3-deoxygalactonokinase [Halobacteriales archaeon]